MDATVLLYSAVVGLVVIMGLLILLLTAKREKGKTMSFDSRSFFITGVVWFALGLPLQNSGLWLLGIVFLALGLANNEVWVTPKTIKQLAKSGNAIQYLVALVSVLALLLGLVTFLSF